LSPANATVHIAGDVKQSRVEKAFNSLVTNWEGEKINIPAYEIPEQSNAGKIFFIDIPGSKQSVINIGKLALSASDENANNLRFTNEKLGGGSSGDLFQTLRIEKGYTYGAFSSTPSGKEVMPFRLRTSVRANATKASLDIIRDMIVNYGTNYTETDVETIKNKLVKRNTSAFESLNAKLGTLREISKYNRTMKYVEDDQKELVDMSLEDFRTIAKQYLNESEMTYVIVGDKATQFGPVKEFAGGEVIELDIYGNRK